MINSGNRANSIVWGSILRAKKILGLKQTLDSISVSDPDNIFRTLIIAELID